MTPVVEGCHYIYKEFEMKRIISALLLVGLCVPLFAVDGYVGVSTGYDLCFYKQTIAGGQLSYQTSELPVIIDGATYFGAKDNLGIGYGIYTAFPLQTTVEGHSVRVDGSISNTMGGCLSFQYRLNLAKKLDMHIGAGLQFASRKQTDRGYTTQSSTWSIFADCKALYDIASGFSVYGGLALTVPFSTSYKAGPADGDMSSVDVSIVGVGVVPYIGLGYKY